MIPLEIFTRGIILSLGLWKIVISACNFSLVIATGLSYNSHVNNDISKNKVD